MESGAGPFRMGSKSSCIRSETGCISDCQRRYDLSDVLKRADAVRAPASYGDERM
jgi:hypothetical protein